MDFLSRFKGRTNFVTKEGITSLMTESSTPIEKSIPSSQYHTPRQRKSKTVTKEDNPRLLFDKRESNLLLSPKAATMQFAKLTGIERPNQSSNLLRLPLHGGNQYFEDEKLSKINQFYTPQNRHISQRDPHSSNNYTFSQKIAHMKTNNGVNGSHGHSYSQIHSRMSESPKLRNGLSNSIPNKQEFYKNSLLKDTKRNDENRNAESQESRLARMNFIERQEQVIHKYRPKLHSDAEAYAQNWASQSWNTNIKYGSPKN